MSQPATQRHLVSIPFAAFSYNSSLYGSTKIIWSHIKNRPDLEFSVLEHMVPISTSFSQSYERRISMKVTAGSQILEDRDLNDLKRIVESSNHLVQVVHQCPLLAIKFPDASGNTERRIQLRFFNAGEFSTALEILKDIGLPIIDKGAREISAPTSHARVAAPEHTLASAPHSVITDYSLPQKSNPTYVSASEQDRTLERIATSSSPSTFTETVRPSSASTVSFRPGSAPSLATLSTQGIGRPTPRSGSAILSTGNSRLHLGHDDQRDPLPTLRRINSNSTLNFDMRAYSSSSNSSTTIQAMMPPSALINTEYEFKETPSQRIPSFSPFFKPNKPTIDLTHSEHSLFNANGGDYDPNTRSAYFNGNSQQSSQISSEETRPQTLWIPPRRELPFSKPTAHQPILPTASPPIESQSPQITGGKPITHTSSIPPGRSISPRLQNVKSKVLEDMRSPPKRQTLQRSQTVGKSVATIAPEELQLQNLQRSVSRTESATKENDSQINDEVAGTAPTIRPKSAPVSKKRPAATPRSSARVKSSKIMDQSTQTQTSSEGGHTATKTVQNNEGTFGTENPPSLEACFKHLNATIIDNRVPNAPKELWELPGYSTASEEERHAMINNMICENLENEDFMVLCEDIENAWQKMGL